MNNTGLQWSASSNQSWATIEPSNGTGSMDVIINITDFKQDDPSTYGNEPYNEAILTFTSEGENKEFIIRRCVNTECVYGEPSEPTYEYQETEVVLDCEYTGNYIVQVPYTATTVRTSETTIIDCPPETSTTTGLSSITVSNITKYDYVEGGQNPRIVSSVSGVYTVKQTMCNETCQCSDAKFMMNGNEVSTITWSQTEQQSQATKIVSVDVGGKACITNFNVNVSSDFTANYSNGTITIKCVNQNMSESEVSTNLSITYKAANNSCTKTIELKREKRIVNYKICPENPSLDCEGTITFTVIEDTQNCP